jgi:hypothetical protein
MQSHYDIDTIPYNVDENDRDKDYHKKETTYNVRIKDKITGKVKNENMTLRRFKHGDQWFLRVNDRAALELKCNDKNKKCDYISQEAIGKGIQTITIDPRYGAKIIACPAADVDKAITKAHSKGLETIALPGTGAIAHTQTSFSKTLAEARKNPKAFPYIEKFIEKNNIEVMPAGEIFVRFADGTTVSTNYPEMMKIDGRVNPDLRDVGYITYFENINPKNPNDNIAGNKKGTEIVDFSGIGFKERNAKIEELKKDLSVQSFSITGWSTKNTKEPFYGHSTLPRRTVYAFNKDTKKLLKVMNFPPIRFSMIQGELERAFPGQNVIGLNMDGDRYSGFVDVRKGSINKENFNSNNVGERSDLFIQKAVNCLVVRKPNPSLNTLPKELRPVVEELALKRSKEDGVADVSKGINGKIGEIVPKIELPDWRYPAGLAALFSVFWLLSPSSIDKPTKTKSSKSTTTNQNTAPRTPQPQTPTPPTPPASPNVGRRTYNNNNDEIVYEFLENNTPPQPTPKPRVEKTPKPKVEKAKSPKVKRTVNWEAMKLIRNIAAVGVGTVMTAYLGYQGVFGVKKSEITSASMPNLPELPNPAKAYNDYEAKSAEQAAIQKQNEQNEQNEQSQARINAENNRMREVENQRIRERQQAAQKAEEASKNTFDIDINEGDISGKVKITYDPDEESIIKTAGYLKSSKYPEVVSFLMPVSELELMKKGGEVAKKYGYQILSYYRHGHVINAEKLPSSMKKTNPNRHLVVDIGSIRVTKISDRNVNATKSVIKKIMNEAVGTSSYSGQEPTPTLTEVPASRLTPEAIEALQKQEKRKKMISSIRSEGDGFVSVRIMSEYSMQFDIELRRQPNPGGYTLDPVNSKDGRRYYRLMDPKKSPKTGYGISTPVSPLVAARLIKNSIKESTK